jgi:hypothetical protein
METKEPLPTDYYEHGAFGMLDKANNELKKKDELKQKVKNLVMNEGVAEGIWYDDLADMLEEIKTDLMILRASDVIGSIH